LLTSSTCPSALSADIKKTIFTEEILELIGLPVNSSENSDLFNKTGASKTSNKVLVMMLYICCLIQQIAGKNKYIKCYLLKLDRIKDLKTDNNMNLIASVNNWKQYLKVFSVKVYYKAGIWIAYGLNIYLPLLQSLSFSRAILLVVIVSTFIVHINALRVATVGGQVFLDKTYTMWKIVLAIKVVNIAMLVVGVFGVTNLLREKLSLIKDSSDYLVINYMGVESMEPSIISSISTLQNCQDNGFIKSNRLRTYFVIEMLTFIFTKIAMKVINIQRIYSNNLVGFVTSQETFFRLKQQKPKLFRVYKIYHKYIIGSQFIANKAGNKIFSNISSFLARIYTSLIYVITLSISVFSNISLLMFVSLYYFLNYFIRMNKIFLQYLSSENVEKVLDISKL
jgi:limonene-1,2-epoxide hydrolase